MDAALHWRSPMVTAKRARVAAWAATLALLAIAALLVARRLAGAFDSCLDAAQLVVTLLIGTAIVLAARTTWQRAGGQAFPRERSVLAWLGSIALWALCLGCAPPSVHSAAWLLWLPVVIVDHVARQLFLTHLAPQRNNEPAASVVPPLAPPFEGGGAETAAIVQELTRSRTADGVETVRGTLCAEFAAGQRHATLHIGFCPPLGRLPIIEVESVDGPDATVKVTQTLAHGAALELRLAEPAKEPCSVVVEFSATPSDSPSHRPP